MAVKSFVGISALILLTACVASPPPQVSDLIKIKAPTFGGLSQKKFTIPSQVFTLSGECDQLSHSIDYNFDGGPWTQMSPGCPNGTFSKSLTVIEGITKIYVRAKGKFDYSDSALATVHFVLPPTTPYQTMVQSSASDASDLAGPGTQNTMGLNLDGAEVSGSQNRVDIYLPWIVYGK